MQSWGGENADDLLGHLLTNDLTDTLGWMSSDMIGDFMTELHEWMQTALNAAPVSEHTFLFELEKEKDGDWKITNITGDMD